MLPKLILAFILLLILFSTVFLITNRQNMNSSSKPIVFFGNSITAGQGAGAGEDFPSLIGKKLNVPVINAGVSGDTSGDALLRINKDVISKNPSIVVIELGGNDLLQGISSDVTKRNMDLILSKIKPTGAKIVILGVHIILFGVKYEATWQEIAQKNNAIYVPNILEGVMIDNSFKFDDIHPNANGYQKIADKLIPVIKALTVQ